MREQNLTRASQSTPDVGAGQAVNQAAGQAANQTVSRAASRAASRDALASVPDLTRRLAASVGSVLKGKDEAIWAAITTLLAGGHILLEDVPGVGKTTLASSLAHSLDAGVRRIQFTSDMLPTDVTGLSVYDQETRNFRFHPGPIFTNIVVGDEINRATPKTQSALLEAMEERSVTIEGTTHRLPELFAVVATQNPHDMEGTFALPEAQRDRFMTRISLGYPSPDAELAMITSRTTLASGRVRTAVASIAEVVRAQQAVARVHLSDDAARYLVSIVAGTRTHAEVSLGGSPRSGLHLAAMARARAAIHGRDYVLPDDIAQLARTVLTHRIVPSGRFATMREEHAAASAIVAELVARTPVR